MLHCNLYWHIHCNMSATFVFILPQFCLWQIFLTSIIYDNLMSFYKYWSEHLCLTKMFHIQFKAAAEIASMIKFTNILTKWINYFSQVDWNMHRVSAMRTYFSQVDWNMHQVSAMRTYFSQVDWNMHQVSAMRTSLSNTWPGIGTTELHITWNI